MRARFLLALGSIAMSLVVPLAASAGDDIVIRQAWSRATPKGAQVAGGYLTIENHGSSPDKLLSAVTTAAAKVEIHAMTTLDGIMIMRPLDDGLTIPPGDTVTLAPGGNHLMFIAISAPFRKDDRVPATLNFEKAGRIDTVFDVQGIGANGPSFIMASAETAAPLPPSSSDDTFFTHICGTRVMANVTVSPGRRGPVEVLVELEDASERPLAAQALSVTLSSPDNGIAATTAKAVRVSDQKWQVRLSAGSSGKWTLALGVEIAPGDRVDMAAPILIE
jgi:copper(I)-binding protein